MSYTITAAEWLAHSDILNDAPNFTTISAEEASQNKPDSAGPLTPTEFFTRYIDLAQMPFFTVRRISGVVGTIPGKTYQRNTKPYPAHDPSAAQLLTPIEWFARYIVTAQMPFFMTRSINEICSDSKKVYMRNTETHPGPSVAVEDVEADADDEMSEVSPFTQHLRYPKMARAPKKQHHETLLFSVQEQGKSKAEGPREDNHAPFDPDWDAWSDKYTENAEHYKHLEGRQHEIEQNDYEEDDEEDDAWPDDDEQGESTQYYTAPEHNAREQTEQPEPQEGWGWLLAEGEEDCVGQREVDRRINRWLGALPDGRNDLTAILERNIDENESDIDSMFNVIDIWKDGIDR